MDNQAQDKIRDLKDKEAVDKLKSLIKSAQVCMFETILPSPPYSVRPMSPVETDEQGNIWFFSKKTSNKNREIGNNANVQLAFSNMADSEFLTIYGNAEIIIDKNKFEELWTPLVKAWFPDGKEDVELSLIKVTPKTAHYWDTKHNKMISMLKIFTAVVTGKPMDDGIEGDLKL
jgi:general stress protein 26